jgi:hypothetical protein
MGFWPTFHRARLHPIGALPHPVGGYRLQQRVKQCDHDSTFSEDQSGSKTVDSLEGSCEAQLTGAQPLAQRGPDHNRSNQIVGQYVHPKFLPNHLRGAAPQHVHPQGGLDRAQSERTVPALALELRPVVSAVEPRVA